MGFDVASCLHEPEREVARLCVLHGRRSTDVGAALPNIPSVPSIPSVRMLTCNQVQI